MLCHDLVIQVRFLASYIYVCGIGYNIIVALPAAIQAYMAEGPLISNCITNFEVVVNLLTTNSIVYYYGFCIDISTRERIISDYIRLAESKKCILAMGKEFEQPQRIILAFKQNYTYLITALPPSASRRHCNVCVCIPLKGGYLRNHVTCMFSHGI